MVIHVLLLTFVLPQAEVVNVTHHVHNTNRPVVQPPPPQEQQQQAPPMQQQQEQLQQQNGVSQLQQLPHHHPQHQDKPAAGQPAAAPQVHSLNFLILVKFIRHVWLQF